MQRYLFGILMVLGTLISSVSAVDDITVRLSLDRMVTAPGKHALATVVVSGSAASAIPEAPFVNGLAIRYDKDASAMSAQDGAMSQKVYVYKVTPSKEGTFSVGPFTVSYNGVAYRSDIVSLRVTKEAVGSERVSGQSSVGAFDLSRHMYLVCTPVPETVFVGQRVPIVIDFYSDWLDVEEVSVTQLRSLNLVVEPLHKQQARVVPIDQTKYAVLSYAGSVIAPAPGDFSIDPVTLTGSIVRRTTANGKKQELLNDNEAVYSQLLAHRASFPLRLQTHPIRFRAVALPDRGKPDTFKGAIGTFSVAMTASPTTVPAGKSITVQIEVKGEGNFGSIGNLGFAAIDGARVYDPQVKKEAGRIIFEQVVRINSTDVKAIPQLVFSYFDPAIGQYVTVTQGPIPITVVGGLMPVEKTAPQKKQKPPLGKELIAIKRIADPWQPLAVISASACARAPWRLRDLIALIVVGIAWYAHHRMRVLSADTPYARWVRGVRYSKRALPRLEALARRATPAVFYDAVFVFLQEYLGLRFSLSPHSISGRDSDELLYGRLSDSTIIDDVRYLFYSCYRARFAPGALSRDMVQDDAMRLRRLIEYLNTQESL